MIQACESVDLSCAPLSSSESTAFSVIDTASTTTSTLASSSATTTTRPTTSSPDGFSNEVETLACGGGQGSTARNQHPSPGFDASSTNLDSPYPPDVKAGFDELCPVCGDKVSGYHYGLLTCESCKGFFKRTVQNKKVYSCVDSRQCPIDKSQRKRCPYCRFQKCLNVGMKLEAVRQDRMRGGRNKFGPMYKRDRAMKQQQFRSQQRLSATSAGGECGEAAGGLQQPGSPPDIKPDPALLQASLGLGYGSPTAMANHVDISSMAAAMAAAVVGGGDGMRGGDGRDGLATSPTSGSSYVNLSHPANPAPARNLLGGGGGGGSPPIHMDDGSSRALNLHTSQHQQQQQHNGLQHHSPHSGRNNNNNSSNSSQHHPHPHHLPPSHSHAHPTTTNAPQPHTSHTHPPPTPVMDNNHPYLLHNANNNPPSTHHHHGYPVTNANTSTTNPKENGMSPSSITGGGGGGSSNGSSMSMDNLRGFGAPPPTLPGLLREIKANLLEEGEMKQKMLSFLTDTLRQMDGGLGHADHLLPIVCRMVDQLLFLMVEWARSSPFFKEIRVEDQMKLLQHSWSEILILDFVYRQVHEYWGTELMLPNGPRLSFETLDKLGLSDVRVHLFELIKKSRELKLDYNEYMCLKFLILLNPDVSSLENRQYVEQSQEKVNAALREYCLAFYPNLKDKFGQILLRLPEIRIISIQLEEFLYYKHLNNLVPDQTLLTEMLQSRRK